MITPKLTAVMVAMTALVGAGPIAAFAQATNSQTVGDLVNAANVETGGNVQVNNAETTQAADNSIEISNEAESEAESGDADSDADGGDAKAKAESGDSESGDSKSYKGDSYSGDSESEAEAEAEGGDAESEAESGDAESEANALQVVTDNTFDNSVDQTSETTQANVLTDNDDVTVTQANVPVQVQDTPIAVDLELLLEGLEI